MKSTSLTVRENTSGTIESAGIIVSLRSAMPSGSQVVVGFPGLPNVERKMQTGDVLLYETSTHGTIEIRAMAMNTAQAEFLITPVTPRFGILAGAAKTDPNNALFSPSELLQVSESIASVKAGVLKGNYLATEQFDLLSRKLDDIEAAASRLGRKDWIVYAAGSLTSLFLTASFAPEVTRKILMATNEAFSWLFSTGILLLP